MKQKLLTTFMPSIPISPALCLTMTMTKSLSGVSAIGGGYCRGAANALPQPCHRQDSALCLRPCCMALYFFRPVPLVSTAFYDVLPVSIYCICNRMSHICVTCGRCHCQAYSWQPTI